MNPSYRLCNLVYTAVLTGNIDVKELSFMVPDVKLSGRNSSLLIRRPYATFLLQKSGRLIIFKCSTCAEATDAVNKLISHLEDNCYTLIIVNAPRLCNIVGVMDLGHRLDLGLLSTQITCEYEPLLHVSLFAKVNGTTATVTHTGKITIFGAKSEEQFVETVHLLTEMGRKAAIMPVKQ